MGSCCCRDVSPIRQYGGCGCCCEDPRAVTEPITEWNFRFRQSGLRDGINPAILGGPITSWLDEIGGTVLVRAGGGTLTAQTFGNALGALQSGDAEVSNNTAPTYAAVIGRSWLFALQVPTVIPAGNGPASTFNVVDKNFPLVFKPGGPPGSMILASQPRSFNCEAAVDIASWAGLNAIIMVQQGDGMNPRFSCWVDTIGAVSFSAVAGEDPSAANVGLALGGWYGPGGEYPWIIGQAAEIDVRVTDALADAEVAFMASYYGFS